MEDAPQQPQFPIPAFHRDVPVEEGWVILQLKEETIRTHRDHPDKASELLTETTNISVVQVNTQGIPHIKFYRDPEFFGGVYTYSHTPASAVSRLKASPARVAYRYLTTR